MPTTATPALRFVRAGVVGSAVLAVSALAHTAGGGLLPGTPALLALLAAATLVAAPLLGRQVRTGQLVALLAAEQAALHLGLSLTAPAAHSAHVHGHQVEQVHQTGHGGSMLLAHVLATLVLAGWLRAAERRTWALLTLLADRTGAAVSHRVRLAVALLGSAALPVQLRTRPLPAPHHRLLLAQQRFGTAVVRRGPPQPVG